MSWTIFMIFVFLWLLLVVATTYMLACRHIHANHDRLIHAYPAGGSPSVLWPSKSIKYVSSLCNETVS
jgi:hypothetical protein